MLAKISDAMTPEGERLEVHCFDPWLIMRVKTGQEAKAKESLMREGFEVYYPSWREIVSVTIPAEKISSKTRYRRRSERREIERVRLLYPGYQFIRRLFGCFDIFRAYELTGVTGLCCFGETPATLPDYMIELMRLEAAQGENDEWRPSVKIQDIRAAKRQRARQERGEPIPQRPRTREVGRLDESGRTVLFIEELGRITRIITSHEVAQGDKSRVPAQVRSAPLPWK